MPRKKETEEQETAQETEQEHNLEEIIGKFIPLPNDLAVMVSGRRVVVNVTQVPRTQIDALIEALKDVAVVVEVQQAPVNFLFPPV